MSRLNKYLVLIVIILFAAIAYNQGPIGPGSGGNVVVVNPATTGAYVRPGTGAIFPVSSTTLASESSLLKLLIAQGASATGVVGSMIQMLTSTAAPTHINGTVNPLSGTVTGGLRVNVENLVVDPAEGATITVPGSLIAGQATTTQRTAVADGTATRVALTIDGRVINLPYAPAGQAVEGRTAAITDQTSTQVIAAVASNFLYITTVYVQNAHPTAGTWVEFEDGTGGAKVGPPIWAGPLGGGGTVKLDPPIRLTTATALYVVAATTGTSYRAYARGYKSVN